MKTTVVPAQVTTVEDKVAGNLSFTQLLLLIVPVFLNGALFVLFPPFFKLTAVKLTMGAVLAIVCMTLAIRIKGKLLMTWAVVIARYNLRAKQFIYNKNDLYMRNSKQLPKLQTITPSVEVASEETPKRLFIPTAEMVRLETAVFDPRAKFHFKTTRKGALRVYINEIKEESI